MDEDRRDLVDRLCAQAGMILEDAALTALTSVRIDDEAEIKSHLDDLGEQLARAHALVQASSALIE